MSLLSEYDSIHALQTALASKKLSATELAQEQLKQAQSAQALNAFTQLDSAYTLAQAKAADVLLAVAHHRRQQDASRLR